MLHHLNIMLLSIDPNWLSFIGDLLVAMAALIGVALTGVFAIRQYRSEQRERAKDRARELRKQLMIEGIRGANAAGQVFGASHNLDTRQDELNERFQSALSTFMTAMSMAKLPTVRLAREFHSAILRQHLEVSIRREALVRLNDEWVESKRAAEERLRAIEVGETGIAKGQVEEWKELKNAAEEREANLMLERGHFARANLRRLDGFMPELYRVIGSVRKDLGLDGSVEEFTQAVRINSMEMGAMIDEVMTALETTDRDAIEAAHSL